MIMKLPFSIHPASMNFCFGVFFFFLVFIFGRSYFRGRGSMWGRGEGTGPMWQLERGNVGGWGVLMFGLWKMKSSLLCRRFFDLPVTTTVAISILNAEGNL